MIAKQYRLTEREVKKALQRGKPFFSHELVFNALQNKLSYNRFAIVIGGKSVQTAIARNFFRRLFYGIARKSINTGTEKFYDVVCVVKKQTKLNQNDEKNVAILKKDIHFLLLKVFTKRPNK